MKPTRGSQRASSKAPKGNKPSKKAQRRRKSQEETQPGTSSVVPQPKPKKNKFAAPPPPKKVKGQDKWKPLSKSSITALDSMLGVAILSVLGTQRTEKEESQKHLNILKNMFIAKCSQLAVPVQKQEMFGHAFRQLKEENKKSGVGKKNLSILEGDVDAVVASLEEVEEQRDALEHQCSNLRKMLELEEDANQQILQLTEQSVLHVPALPSRQDRDKTLQKRLLGLVPNEDWTTMACSLAKTLHAPGPLQDARALLEHAYRHADHLLTASAAVNQ
ncbi:hypothetical protein UPYG_G00016500 [Umbra pygmaea]|uniref:Centromere protein Q n=1 Tax=Umbra pygmaea TaxID=75934 RepID=A0ABD0XJS4_UMBPY